MTLTVGEILSTIEVDARPMEAGLRSAERRAEQAGRAIGDGVEEGAARGLRGVGAQFEEAGARAGREMAEAAGDAGGQAADAAGGQVAGRMSESLKAGLAGVGLAAGALLMQGFTQAFDKGRVTGRLGAQLGATPAEAQKYGKIAGKLYSDAVTEDFQSAADTISAVMRAGIAPPGATEKQLESLATKVSDLAGTFELDLGQTANAVGQTIKTGLAKDGAEALDVFTRGLQKMGPRADDLMDTFNEYGVQFQQLGLDVKTSTGLMAQGLQAGARDTDVVADSLKEFLLITQDGGEEASAAFAKIGLSGSKMRDVFTKGGPEAGKALDKVFDGLRGIKDPAERSAVAMDLFGTKSEDTQRALMALDPSNAVKALGETGGAADKMGNSLRDNAGAKFEAFKRGLQTSVVDFLNSQVIPGFDRVGGAISRMWEQAGSSAGGEGLANRIIAFIPMLGERVFEALKGLAPKITSGLSSAGQSAAEWVMANPTSVFKIAAIGAALALAVVSLPALVAAAFSAAAITIMVGFVTRMVNGAVNALSSLGNTFSGWFGGLWSRYISGPVSRAAGSFISYVQGLPGRASSALSALGSSLATRASSAWQAFKDASARKGSELISWVRGIPGRISAAIGNLSGLLVEKGRNVVQGLLNGIKSMGGYLKSQLTSWAKSAIPGPISKALRIGSPSKLMRDQIGRWIPAGVIQGVQRGRAAVARVMENLVPAPTLPTAPAMAVAGGAYGMPYGGAGITPQGGAARVQIEHWHAAENGSPDDNARALEWLAKARG